MFFQANGDSNLPLNDSQNHAFNQSKHTPLAAVLLDKQQEHYFKKQLRIFSIIALREKNTIPSEDLIKLSQKFFLRLSHPKLLMNDKMLGLKQFEFIEKNPFNIDKLIINLKNSKADNLISLISYLKIILPFTNNSQSLEIINALLPWLNHQEEKLLFPIIPVLTALILKIEVSAQPYIYTMLKLLDNPSFWVQRAFSNNLKLLVGRMDLECALELAEYVDKCFFCREDLWFCLSKLSPFNKDLQEKLLKIALQVSSDEKTFLYDKRMAYRFILSNIDALDRYTMFQVALKISSYLVGPCIDGIHISIEMRAHMQILVNKLGKTDLGLLAEDRIQKVKNDSKSAGVCLGIIVPTLEKQSLLKLTEQVKNLLTPLDKQNQEGVFALLETLVFYLDASTSDDLFWKVYSFYKAKKRYDTYDIFNFFTATLSKIPLEMRVLLVEDLFPLTMESYGHCETLDLLVSINHTLEKKQQEKLFLKILTLLNSDHTQNYVSALEFIAKANPLLEHEVLQHVIAKIIVFLPNDERDLQEAIFNCLEVVSLQMSPEDINRLINSMHPYMNQYLVKKAYFKLAMMALKFGTKDVQSIIQNVFSCVHDDDYSIRELCCHFFNDIVCSINELNRLDVILKIIDLASDQYEDVRIAMIQTVLTYIPLLSANDLKHLVPIFTELLNSQYKQDMAVQFLSAIILHPDNQELINIDLSNLNIAEKQFINLLANWVGEIKKNLFDSTISLNVSP